MDWDSIIGVRAVERGDKIGPVDAYHRPQLESPNAHADQWYHAPNRRTTAWPLAADRPLMGVPRRLGCNDSSSVRVLLHRN